MQYGVSKKTSSRIKDMETQTPSDRAKNLLEAVKARAIELWGDKWLASLVRAHSEVIGAEDVRGRYVQIKRIFTHGNCTIETLSGLIMAVDCKLQLICYEKPKVINL
jgi:hypothetical protein